MAPQPRHISPLRVEDHNSTSLFGWYGDGDIQISFYAGANIDLNGASQTLSVSDNPVFNSISTANYGVSFADAYNTHYITLGTGESLTGNRTLTLTLGDANRSLTLSGNATLSGTNSGDQTITLTGAVTGSGTASFATTLASGAVSNAHVAAGAAIAFGKMAALTASRALASDGSGVVSPTSVTATELGYLSGVTSAIQTQLSGKAATTGNASIATVGTVTSGTWQAGAIGIAYGGTGQTTANGALNAFLPSQTGNNGKVLQTDGTNTSWASVGGTGTVTSVNITPPAAGISASGGPVTGSGSITLSLADDLAALEALTGTDTIYYRSGSSTWSAVTVGSNLTFTGGTLSASGGGSGRTQGQIFASSINTGVI